MRYTKYITTLFALIAISACTIADIDNQVTVGNTAKGDKIQVLGRITRFADVDVSTRGVKDQDEAKLTSMALAIFKVNETGDGLEGNCVHYQYADDQAELLFTIERGSNYAYNTRYAMYVFCNMPGMENFGVGSTLADMMNAFYEVKNINIPTNGFPMMGSLGDTFSTTFDKDGRVFVLSPTAENGDLTTPKVDGVTQTLLTIPMKAMFAKVNFTIEVRPDQTIEGSYSPQFTLESYTVNNVPSIVDFNNGSNDDAAVLDGSFNLPIKGNTVASGANKINFTFYLPERYLTPTYQSHDGSKDEQTGYYNYPFPVVNGKYRDEDLDFRQRYKPELVGDKKATNVKITGRFRDHQNHHWDVDYTIYLGEDNYSDFNIKRNCEYHNYITIRGIQSSSDMSDKENAISIDHRVNVERTQPAIISLRRETLLDSHFEVRPLRVRKSKIVDAQGINAVKVEVVNPTTTNWMRLERSFGDGTPADSPTNESGQSIYITDAGSSYGKRRYFTYNLVDGKTPGTHDYSLVNSTAVVLPLTDDTECCWIYVDECTEIGDAVRSGIIKVTYGSGTATDNFVATNDIAFSPVEYVINQRKLFKVQADTREYHIEYEEEYLHNFDADDEFGHTNEEGMYWGINNIQLSYDHRSISFSDGLKEWLTSNARPYYDFYIEKYDASDANISSGELHKFEGYNFCNEIIQVVNGQGNHDTDTSNDIDILQLNQKPNSAIEYCYNKNKRNSEGSVVWADENSATGYNQTQLNWYLPAIDEMEDVIVSTYGNNLKSYARFLDFQNNFYWSCQPAFIKNFAYYGGITSSRDQWGPMYVDNTEYARATKVIYLGDDQYDYARSGIAYTKDSNNNDVYYNAWYYAWGGILGTTHYTPANGTVTIDRKVTITLSEVIGQEGYLLRSSYARVRCVRKQ